MKAHKAWKELRNGKQIANIVWPKGTYIQLRADGFIVDNRGHFASFRVERPDYEEWIVVRPNDWEPLAVAAGWIPPKGST